MLIGYIKMLPLENIYVTTTIMLDRSIDWTTYGLQGQLHLLFGGLASFNAD
jgi:hypothetical protein